jgi:hypothetical protein
MVKNRKNNESEKSPPAKIDAALYAEQLFLIWDKVQEIQSNSEKFTDSGLSVQAIENQARLKKLNDIQVREKKIKGSLPPETSKVFKSVGNFEEFEREFEQVLGKIEESCLAFKKPVPKFCSDEIDLEKHFKFACEWIEENKLSLHKPVVLRFFVQLLPALIDYSGMRRVINQDVTRLNAIKHAIDTLNRYGIISDDILLADRKIWGIIRNSIKLKMRPIAQNQKYLSFNPPLLKLIRFLKSIEYRGRGNLLFSLFLHYDLLKKIFPKKIGKTKLTPLEKREIIGMLGSDVNRLLTHLKLEDMTSYPRWKLFL